MAVFSTSIPDWLFQEMENRRQKGRSQFIAQAIAKELGMIGDNGKASEKEKEL